MSVDKLAKVQLPNIHDKLLHLGFQACASDNSTFLRPDLKELSIVLHEDRLNIRHEGVNGAAPYEAYLHQQAALNNVQLETHVRGAVRKAFGFEAAKAITNFPYSEQRLESFKVAIKPNLP